MYVEYVEMVVNMVGREEGVEGVESLALSFNVFSFLTFFFVLFGIWFSFCFVFVLGEGGGFVLFSLYVLTDNYLVIVIRFLIAAHFAAILRTIFDRSLYHFLLSIHCAAAMTRLLPRVIVFNQTGY